MRVPQDISQALGVGQRVAQLGSLLAHLATPISTHRRPAAARRRVQCPSTSATSPSFPLRPSRSPSRLRIPPQPINHPPGIQLTRLGRAAAPRLRRRCSRIKRQSILRRRSKAVMDRWIARTRAARRSHSRRAIRGRLKQPFSGALRTLRNHHRSTRVSRPCPAARFASPRSPTASRTRAHLPSPTHPPRSTLKTRAASLGNARASISRRIIVGRICLSRR